MQTSNVSFEGVSRKYSFWDLHKFTILRNLSYAIVTLLVILIPILKIVKIDIAHNMSWVLGKETTVEAGLGPVIIALGFFAILVVVLNLINGRLFCGWICPGGWVAEIQEKFRRFLFGPRSSKTQRYEYLIVTFIMTIIFTLIFFNWITDLRVFIYKTNPAFVPMWLAFVGGAGIIYFELFIGKRWCRVFCPTGIYQKITPQNHIYKTTMASWASLEDCGHCRECIKNCPMALDPRRMAYINDFYKGLQACISCGYCIDTCKQVMVPQEKEPLMVWVKELPPRDPDFIEGKTHHHNH